MRSSRMVDRQDAQQQRSAHTPRRWNAWPKWWCYRDILSNSAILRWICPESMNALKKGVLSTLPVFMDSASESSTPSVNTGVILDTLVDGPCSRTTLLTSAWTRVVNTGVQICTRVHVSCWWTLMCTDPYDSYYHSITTVAIFCNDAA